ALLKLSPDLGDESRLGRLGSLQLKFSAQGEAPEDMARLWEAVVKRRTVKFTYRSLGKREEHERLIDPYGLYFERGAWYVVGYCHLREDIRSFRLSRMKSGVELAAGEGEGQDFERPEDFKLEDYSRTLPWEFEEGAEYTALVRFSPRMAWLVERDLGSVYNFREEEDGGGILEVKVRNQDAFVSWLLSFAEDAEVLSPPELRDKVREWLRMILEKAGGDENA
ncbi:MAG: helix-turn-helix transcriptional regulator, partial [Actinomycetota bacterium]